mgnify:CR=1 FL=1
MKKINLSDFFRGWLVGNFEPSLLKSKDIEVAIQEYKAGHTEPKHFHKIATEITVMVVGEAMFNDEIVQEGEGMVIMTGESNIFNAITDCKALVIKFPSLPEDKYLQ